VTDDWNSFGSGPGRRAAMTLYSDPESIYSHRTRIVLAEKGIVMDINNVGADDFPEDLAALNPDHSTPTLLDRDLVLYDSRVIMDYIDERFPHPPLMPVDPVSRAQVRLALYRVEKDWYTHADQLERCLKDGDRRQLGQVRKILQEALLSSADVFAAKRYFLSDEFSLVDASVAPLLWRLPRYGIELNGNAAQPIRRYMDSMFIRRSFKESLSEAEREMRQ
jgi:RNA polymerase-associated protein